MGYILFCFSSDDYPNDIKYITPPLVSFQQVNASMEADTPNESNDFTLRMKNNELDLCPLSLFAFGEGLPSAPVEWPNQVIFGDGRYGGEPINLASMRRGNFFFQAALRNPDVREKVFLSIHAWREDIKTVYPSRIDIMPLSQRQLSSKSGLKTSRGVLFSLDFFVCTMISNCIMTVIVDSRDREFFNKFRITQFKI